VNKDSTYNIMTDSIIPDKKEEDGLPLSVKTEK